MTDQEQELVRHDPELFFDYLGNLSGAAMAPSAHGDWIKYDAAATALREQAERIAELEAENERLQSEYAETWAERNGWKARAEIAESRLDRLRNPDAVAKLVEAAFLEGLREVWGDEEQTWHNSNARRSIADELKWADGLSTTPEEMRQALTRATQSQ